MTWIGMRDAEVALWQPPASGRATLPDVVPRGALMIEFSAGQGPVRRNILRQSSRDPWDFLLTVAVEPDGSLVCMQRWQGESRVWHLPLPGLREPEKIILTLQWDGPAQTGLLSAYLPDRPRLYAGLALPPLPLHRRDLERLVTDPATCKLDPTVRWIGISDHPVPVGPVGGVSGDAPVKVPGGIVPARSLRVGDRVCLSDGSTVPLLWAGSVRMPAHGRMRPHMLRMPWFGLTDDVTVSSDTRLRLQGMDIEYLFGSETIAAAARQLSDGRRVQRLSAPPTLRWYQFLPETAVDQTAAMLIGGVAIETFDLAALAHDPRLAVVTMLGRMDLPAIRAPAVRRLQDFEATTLRRMFAA